VLDRLRLSPRLFPLAAAPVLGALGVVEAASDPEFRDTFVQLAVVAAWFAGSFLVAAWRPAVGAVLVACFYPLTVLLGAPGPGGTGLIAAMLAMGYVGYASPPRRSMVAVTVAVVVFVATAVWQNGFSWDAVFFPAVFYPARWAGRLVSREQERSAQLVELTALLDAQRESAAAAAAAEERQRIAREVHDAVAHSVSVMTLQIGGLRRQLAGPLAERPHEQEVMLGLERLGRETVEELRSLVGILREPGHTDASTAPVPSLLRADDVVADVRAAGLDVSLEVVGTPRELPRALDLSAFRILQEALTNVLRHAPGGRATVVVDYTREGVEIHVRDDGPGPGVAPILANGARAAGGHGIVGMRERAQMFGGTLVAAPAGDGFEVRASLPTTRASGRTR
jgi:signal transduction histidine kinase